MTQQFSLPTPTRYFMTASGTEGHSKLNAFDNALLAAKIGNLNLLRVSSILPPGCLFVPNLKIPEGSLVPVAYGSIISDIPGKIISAAMAIGFAKKDTYGVIMEYTGECGAEEAERTITEMVEKAFFIRQMDLKDIKTVAVEHQIVKIGCAFAAIPMWY
ncbi:arginine decarboxylase, pyruvoyl-dependent [Desulfosporosinus sp. PR]|uniref:pyruvoyl-dependent arginine decarboxylase n=1 Tax=Candidatus Desulfosporosinus nitrosoreducens TaxID=3401928 RepID=UPI0027F05F4D|nr:arginine decarboxylase, pyruvoyl-dependent [Desulfosporosinus sp. PR]MDQ7094379.1 arginine decarboxylase, pyruvoyl-dependent [Desulfosporosinus sp. PR]